MGGGHSSAASATTPANPVSSPFLQSAGSNNIRHPSSGRFASGTAKFWARFPRKKRGKGQGVAEGKEVDWGKKLPSTDMQQSRCRPPGSTHNPSSSYTSSIHQPVNTSVGSQPPQLSQAQVSRGDASRYPYPRTHGTFVLVPAASGRHSTPSVYDPAASASNRLSVNPATVIRPRPPLNRAIPTIPESVSNESIKTQSSISQSASQHSRLADDSNGNSVRSRPLHSLPEHSVAEPQQSAASARAPGELADVAAAAVDDDWSLLVDKKEIPPSGTQLPTEQPPSPQLHAPPPPPGQRFSPSIGRRGRILPANLSESPPVKARHQQHHVGKPVGHQAPDAGHKQAGERIGHAQKAVQVPLGEQRRLQQSVGRQEHLLQALRQGDQLQGAKWKFPAISPSVTPVHRRARPRDGSPIASLARRLKGAFSRSVDNTRGSGSESSLASQCGQLLGTTAPSVSALRHRSASQDVNGNETESAAIAAGRRRPADSAGGRPPVAHKCATPIIGGRQSRSGRPCQPAAEAHASTHKDTPGRAQQHTTSTSSTNLASHQTTFAHNTSPSSSGLQKSTSLEDNAKRGHKRHRSAGRFLALLQSAGRRQHQNEPDEQDKPDSARSAPPAHLGSGAEIGANLPVQRTPSPQPLPVPPSPIARITRRIFHHQKQTAAPGRMPSAPLKADKPIQSKGLAKTPVPGAGDRLVGPARDKSRGKSPHAHKSVQRVLQQHQSQTAPAVGSEPKSLYPPGQAPLAESEPSTVDNSPMVELPPGGLDMLSVAKPTRSTSPLAGGGDSKIAQHRSRARPQRDSNAGVSNSVTPGKQQSDNSTVPQVSEQKNRGVSGIKQPEAAGKSRIPMRTPQKSDASQQIRAPQSMRSSGKLPSRRLELQNNNQRLNKSVPSAIVPTTEGPRLSQHRTTLPPRHLDLGSSPTDESTCSESSGTGSDASRKGPEQPDEEGEATPRADRLNANFEQSVATAGDISAQKLSTAVGVRSLDVTNANDVTKNEGRTGDEMRDSMISTCSSLDSQDCMLDFDVSYVQNSTLERRQQWQQSLENEIDRNSATLAMEASRFGMDQALAEIGKTLEKLDQEQISVGLSDSGARVSKRGASPATSSDGGRVTPTPGAMAATVVVAEPTGGARTAIFRSNGSAGAPSDPCHRQHHQQHRTSQQPSTSKSLCHPLYLLDSDTYDWVENELTTVHNQLTQLQQLLGVDPLDGVRNVPEMGTRSQPETPCDGGQVWPKHATPASGDNSELQSLQIQLDRLRFELSSRDVEIKRLRQQQSPAVGNFPNCAAQAGALNGGVI